MTIPKDFNSGGGSSWSAEQLRNANTIINIGLKMGFGWRDIKIALMTAMQESSLINNSGGDRDSAGLFQQRPSMGWGTYDQVTDPQYATRKFYNTLKGVHNRDDMPLWAAAQEVQRSAYPTAYRQHFGSASTLIKAFRANTQGIADSGVNPTGPDLAADPGLALQQFFNRTEPGKKPKVPGPLSAPSPPGMGASIEPVVLPQFASRGDYNQAVEKLGMLPQGSKSANQMRRQIVKFAKRFIGTPYVYGGNSLTGGIDCSGFTQQVFEHFGINLPRISYQQGQPGYEAFGRRVNDIGRLRPGDLVLWDNSSRNNGADHVAIYLGNGMIIEAPRPGRSVGISELYDLDQAWGVKLQL